VTKCGRVCVRFGFDFPAVFSFLQLQNSLSSSGDQLSKIATEIILTRQGSHKGEKVNVTRIITLVTWQTGHVVTTATLRFNERPKTEMKSYRLHKVVKILSWIWICWGFSFELIRGPFLKISHPGRDPKICQHNPKSSGPCSSALWVQRIHIPTQSNQDAW